MSYKDFRRMPVWQNAHQLLTRVYSITDQFPAEEKYGLVSDMRRAANSVVHNIAEGFGRFESRDKTRFYKISRGSAYELQSQIETSASLGYIDQNTHLGLYKKYKQVIIDLNRMIKSIENRNQF